MYDKETESINIVCVCDIRIIILLYPIDCNQYNLINIDSKLFSWKVRIPANTDLGRCEGQCGREVRQGH